MIFPMDELLEKFKFAADKIVLERT